MIDYKIREVVNKGECKHCENWIGADYPEGIMKNPDTPIGTKFYILKYEGGSDVWGMKEKYTQTKTVCDNCIGYYNIVD